MIDFTSSPLPTLINNKSDDRSEIFSLTPTKRFETQIEIKKHLRFSILLEMWKKETQFVSSSSAIINNVSYQEIIKMGKDIVPFIIKDLKKNQNNPRFWFPALQAIIGDSPTIPKDVRGNMPEIARIWILWIEKNVPYSD